MIFLIGFLALILRLVSINQSLWLDEGINVNVAKALSYKDLIFNYSLSDFHPPLYHVVLHTWIMLFGSSEISARIPSILFGVGTVLVVYLIAKKLYDAKTALIAATLMATAPLSIYYSQEARMYMMAAFFATLSVYFFIRVLDKDTLINWFGFIISSTLMLYSDYLPYLLIPTYLIYIVINRKKISKSTIGAFIPSLILIFALISPWLLLVPKQLSGGLGTAAASPAWAQVVGGGNVKNLAITFVKFEIGRISYSDKLIYALLFAPIGLYFIFLFVISLFRMSSKRSVLWYWLLIPIFTGFAISFFIPVYSYFRLIFTLGAFYIILASGISTVNWQVLTRTLLALALAINLVSTTIYLTNPAFQRENWRGAVNYISKNSSPQSIVLFESDFTTGPFDYYNQGKLEAAGALKSFNAKNPGVDQKINNLTQNKNKVFLFQYLSQLTDPEGLVFESLTKAGFVNSATKDFNGVGFLYEFNR